MIKIVTVKCGSFSYRHFTKYIAENGKAVCAINDEVVEPDVGNDIYKALRAEGATVVNREFIIGKTDSEIVEYIESGIDKYLQYIENYKQYEQAREHNDKLYKLAEEFKRIAK